MKLKLFTFLFILIFPFFSAKAFAEKIDSFNSNIVAHKNGLLDITETIKYDSENLEKHGIYRFIPLYSKVGNLYRIIKIENVSVKRDGVSEKFEESKTNQKINFKIGNANKTISGPHTYQLSYTVENAVGSNFPDHDEIYWNITGNDWEVPINNARATISTDFDAKFKGLICYSGPLRSTDKICSINHNTVTSSQILYPGYGLTAVAVYPLNTFPKSILSKNPPQRLGEKLLNGLVKNSPLIYLFLNLILAPLIFIWYQRHRNKKRFGSPVVNFDMPKDINNKIIPPAVAGTIDTAKLEREDIVATIFDLAIRKYIKLEEVKDPKKFLRIIDVSKKDQIITKLKEDDGKLTDLEKHLFNRLFESGNSVKVKSLKKDFYETFNQMENDAFSYLVQNKYYVRNPKIQRGFLLFASFLSFVTLNIILGLVFFFLFKKLMGRTSLGDEIDYKIDGLKLFLKSMDKNYKWQVKNFYTIEQMIPYAIALGFIDKFMEQLKVIKPDYSPTWYQGYSGSFFSSYGGFYSSVNSNVTTSAPSSSSGFSGGSSGGGGGGGGGGSW